MEVRKLGRTGLKVSVLGLGASPLGGVFGDIDEQSGVRAVHKALELGVNLIDVSPYYGLTKAERVLGKALAGVARGRYLLATKVGRYGDASFDFSAVRVHKSVDESLRRLGVDYLDLVQCHDIEFAPPGQVVHETLPTLRALQRQGKVRFVGVTGLPLESFPTVLDHAEVDTVLSYCHHTLFDTTLGELVPYLQNKGIGIINASPLAMGLLTEQGPPDWHPAGADIRQACVRAAHYCRQHGTNLAKLALQFSVSHPGVATTLLGSACAGELEQAVAWLAQPLDASFLREVQTILAPIHNRSWPSGRAENNRGVL